MRKRVFVRSAEEALTHVPQLRRAPERYLLHLEPRVRVSGLSTGDLLESAATSGDIYSAAGFGDTVSSPLGWAGLTYTQTSRQSLYGWRRSVITETRIDPVDCRTIIGVALMRMAVLGPARASARRRLLSRAPIIEVSLTDSREATKRNLPAVILNENGNLLFFESHERLTGYIEPVDVKNDEYVAYNMDGELLDLYVDFVEAASFGRWFKREIVMVRPARARDDAGLRSALRGYLERVGASSPEDQTTHDMVRLVASRDDVWY